MSHFPNLSPSVPLCVDARSIMPSLREWVGGANTMVPRGWGAGCDLHDQTASNEWQKQSMGASIDHQSVMRRDYSSTKTVVAQSISPPSILPWPAPKHKAAVVQGVTPALSHISLYSFFYSL
jgi:hypothetical protein